ncbi:MAG: HAMP domain-containing sensor histidine kinase [Bacteroidota bacterium]
MRLSRTIAFRLFLLLASVQLAVLVALTYASVNVHQAHLMNNVVAGAAGVGDVILRSMRHSMMLNRKEDVHNIVASLRGEPGIRGLRIYNKQGTVVFSTDSSDISLTADMAAEACVSCHGSGSLESPARDGGKLWRIFHQPGGERVLGLITPIRNEPQCAAADCHAHDPQKTILGVMDVKMSLEGLDRDLEDSRTKMLWLSGGAVLLVAVVSGVFIWVVVRRPVRGLMEGMAMVSSGNLSHRLAVRSHDELGELARAFNGMTGEVSRAREELTAWSGTLEDKVRSKTAELEKAHRHMIRVEKMASLGSLAATVAHELNNPLEGILTFARLLRRRIQKSSLPPEEAAPYVEELGLVADEAQRCGNIVKNLLAFSRQRGGAFQPVALRSVVDRCILLMNHHARMHNVRLEVRVEEDLTVECDFSQLQQAIVALMVNGIEAMAPNGGEAGEGLLTLAVGGEGERVRISVTDTGVGIRDEIKPHIFEPFFTTKSEGKGVGLGLAVVYGIIQRHHGAIEVESEAGKGTTFILTLPLVQPAAGKDEGALYGEGAEQ